MIRNACLSLIAITVLAACGGGSGSGQATNLDSYVESTPFTIEDVSPRSVQPVDLDTVDPEELIQDFPSVFTVYLVDWDRMHGKGLIETQKAKRNSLSSNGCVESGSETALLSVECNAGYKYQIRVIDTNDGFIFVGRNETLEGAGTISYIADRTQYQKIDAETLTVTADHRFLEKTSDQKDRSYTQLKVDLDLNLENIKKIDADDLWLEFEFNYLSEAGPIKSISGESYNFSPEGEGLSGSYAFESIPRSAEARQQQLGSDYMYQFTSQGKSICAFRGAAEGYFVILLPETPDLMIDRDCNGIGISVVEDKQS